MCAAAYPKRPKILVTVGMGPWPFDRLVSAVSTLSDDFDVFVQTGTSSVVPNCPHAAFISYGELVSRIESADIVITHAGNTVRLVQRAGGVPIAMAREHGRGEMGNDHQVAYLRHEEEHGRVIAVWDADSLDDAVAKHQIESERLLAERGLDAKAEPQQVADLLDDTCARLIATSGPARLRSTPGWDTASPRSLATKGSGVNPFTRHPLRRYDFAWRNLVGLSGAHLDIGAGLGDFAGPFAASSGRPVSAADASSEYAAEMRIRFPDIDVSLVPPDGRTPYDDATFTSVSMLDVLEHVDDEPKLLGEAHRLLVDGGTLVVSVPRRHVFSWLDPDNVKYRWPRLHRKVYEKRFGAAAYERRFVDTSDGFVGDIAVGRGEHTNYRTDDLLALLRQAGFEIEQVAGANLFWRWLHIPYLLGGRRTKAVCESAIRIDGELFGSPRFSANLFVVARRTS
jgi:2-polyprenyl-3-methyl-5-hydroxy-6-metoxy-1,4-benzoquinol methylase